MRCQRSSASRSPGARACTRTHSTFSGKSCWRPELLGERSNILRSATFSGFFLSGASSLVFQTLWSRLLSHVFGSSSIAVSSVVSVFMAGLGLGAFWFGRRADRLRDPLRLYALAETG